MRFSKMVKELNNMWESDLCLTLGEINSELTDLASDMLDEGHTEEMITEETNSKMTQSFTDEITDIAEALNITTYEVKEGLLADVNEYIEDYMD